VRLLLQSGADIDAPGGDYGNALQAASARSHEGIVRLLIDYYASSESENEPDD
jgi:hypothetical protein